MELKGGDDIFGEAERDLDAVRHYTISQVTTDTDKFQFNTAIARLMELFNALYKYVAREKVNASLVKSITRDAVLLLAPFAPVQVFLMAVMIQARHLFYGISMLDRYKGTGWKKPYLIYAMCDETFSVNYTAEIPEGVDHGWFYFFVSLLDELYWFLGATLGGVLGGLLRFNTDGLDFVMTAMFVVIFMDQWLKETHHFSAWIGLAASVACLLLFGADNFLIPTMICILIVLTALRKPIEAKTREAAK